ncbi:MAG: beta-ketoacyl synthase N-terminal-like domain-containing protein [Candidatus Methylumidiphilus sp.]
MDDDVAIIGTACQYPGGGHDPDAFWRFIRNGGSAIGEVPPERWGEEFYSADPDAVGKSASRWGGFLSPPFPGGFDAAFFDLSPTEVQALDPQQRLLLEVGWRALESAGIATDPEACRPIGVFVAISTTDYHGAKLWQPGLAAIDPFTATGASFAAAAGRLSYSFGFNGPSLSIDTACSSSLVAFHLACQSIRQGECEAALVAGVNALLTPHLYVCLSKMGLMSRDGRCKAFDATGDGYVRAEGCGALVLKPLAHALRDGERVLAVCRGSAVNQDGRSNGLTAPSRPAQEAVIRRALAVAKLSFADIDYVEAHGTGTPLGDAIELNALANTYAQGRSRAKPLLVGSVKTNIGHLEAGAGMAGLIKTVQCLRHGEIPPHLHLRQPTPHLAWDEVALTVPTAPTPWPDADRPRRAAVSSFGFSGTNAHAILEAAPRTPPRNRPSPAVVALPLSARTPAALGELAESLARWLEVEPHDLVDVAFTLGAGRTLFTHRRVVIGANAAGLAAALRGKATAPVQGDPWQSRLQELADLWVAGEPVDWARLYRAFGARKLALPGHPFNRQHYWSSPLAATCRPVAPTPNPAAPPPASTPQGRDAWRQVIDGLARRVLSDQPLGSLDYDQALVEQGFTSLLGQELRRHLESVLGRSLPATLLYNYPSINRIAELLAAPSQEADHGAAPLVSSAGTGEFESLDTLDDLSVEQLLNLVQREVDD